MLKETLIARVNRSLTYMSTQTRTPLKYLYYDVYTNFPTANAYYTADATALGAERSTSNIGRLTGEKTALLDYETDMKTWLFKAIYYDKFGRVIQTVTDNHLPIAGSVDYVTNKYNFAGEVTQTRQRHVADYANNYTDTYMDLDHRGRLLKTRYSINGATAILMSAYKYNEAGNLAIQYFHSENDGNFLQKNDYTYNIRGWMTQLNDPATFTENDKFGLKLYYNVAPSGGTATFNGNISGMGWGTTSSSNANANMLYMFTYDAVNRLTNANFSKSGVVAAGLDANYVYNNNGNLTNIRRYNKAGSYIDNISIQYTGNKLNLITDLAGDVANTTDYPGYTTQTGGFSYDLNGNLTQETNKLMNFSYNLLNLPKEVNYWSGANKKIKYFYTFNGEKRRKTVEDNGTFTKVDYCGPFVYETVSGTRSLKYIITPHGRTVKNGSTWDYEYNLTDHLGNVRVVIHKGTSGTAEVLQERHYYPFGMEMSELSYNYGSNIANKYLYNGKEMQNDYNLYWYDFQARYYDPAIVRTPTPDPHSESYYSESPYSFMGNNPINNIDPTGMDWYSYTDDDGNKHYKYQDGSDKSIKVGDNTYSNIGASVNIQLGEGYYYNAFQNYGVSSVDGPVDVKQKILGSASLQDKLLSEGSGFSAQGQEQIMTALIHKGQNDFINHPVTQATISGLTFVATGGIEGFASLGSSVLRGAGNLRIPIYRVYGGASRINGWSWSALNPKLLSKDVYRRLAGLPDVNWGTNYIKGSVRLKDITTLRRALPMDGNPGGLPELLIDPNKVNMWRYMKRPGLY